ncbi:MAG TPA: hypothetical protein VLE70_06505 [Anaerolineae bacterium]|jgi:hypothetical protein|nr:hypothetical protein [Anaerolineae bacterium]
MLEDKTTPAPEISGTAAPDATVTFADERLSTERLRMGINLAAEAQILV